MLWDLDNEFAPHPGGLLIIGRHFMELIVVGVVK